MICSYCGTELREGAVFCPACGTRVDVAKQSGDGAGAVDEDLLAAKTIVADDEEVSSAQPARSDNGESQESSASAPSMAEETPPPPAGAPINPTKAVEQPKKRRGTKAANVLAAVVAAFFAYLIGTFVSIGLSASNEDHIETPTKLPTYTETAESMYDVKNFASMDASHMLNFLDEQGFQQVDESVREDLLLSWEHPGPSWLALTDQGKDSYAKEGIDSAEVLKTADTISLPVVQGKAPLAVLLDLYDFGKDFDSESLQREDLEKGKTHAGGTVGAIYPSGSWTNEEEVISFMKAFLDECGMGDPKHLFKVEDGSETSEIQYVMLGSSEMFGQPSIWSAACTLDDSKSFDPGIVLNFYTVDSFEEITGASSVDQYSSFLKIQDGYTELEP